MSANISTGSQDPGGPRGENHRADFDMTVPRAQALLHASTGMVFVVDRSGSLVDRIPTPAPSGNATDASEPSLQETLWPACREAILACVDRALDAAEPMPFETQIAATDGTVRHWIGMAAPAGPDEVLFWLRDETERAEAEATLHETSMKYRALMEQIPAATYLWDVTDGLDKPTLWVSPQLQTIVGFEPETWMEDAKRWFENIHPEDRNAVIDETARTIGSGQPFKMEYRMLSKEGRVVWVHDEATVVGRDTQGRVTLHQGILLDITAAKEAEEQLAFLAYHDKLTGLPNRVLFEELLDLALARARRHRLALAVLYMDLDDFKLVNDSLGHSAGDEMLRQVAARLRWATRETDLVARQGGDEFMLLLADLEQAVEVDPDNAVEVPKLAAESVANRVHEALRAPFDLGGTDVYVSASIGISLFPHDAEDSETLLKNADVAMYRAKRTGPGRFQVFLTGGPEAVGKLSLATRLRRAVDNQDWVLHYQPVVDLATTETVGVEGLLRWWDPRQGLIAPGEFISLAEEMALIETISDWVLKEVCRQTSRWRADGIVLEASMNLSPRQLWQPDLVAWVLNHVESAGIDPRRLIVELTESAAMTDPDRAQRVLGELHAHGVQLAIDDFGTGYSSLSRLRHLPVDILKIDRTFIRDIPGDEEAAAMVTAVVHLAESLGMTPLAEGIETREQWHFLAERGCRLGQGYFFSRPLPAAELDDALKAGTAGRPPVESGDAAVA